jgi:hypothetical protein
LTRWMPALKNPRHCTRIVFALRRFGCSRYQTLCYNLPPLELGFSVDRQAAIGALHKACEVYEAYPQVAAFRDILGIVEDDPPKFEDDPS